MTGPSTTNHAASIQPRNGTSGHLFREMKQRPHKKSAQHLCQLYFLKSCKVEITQCSPRGNWLYWCNPTMDPGQ